MKEGWEYKRLKECCKELFAGGDVPKPNVSKNKTSHFSVPIYTNGVEDEGLYGYTNNARVNEPAVTISARGTIGATFRRYTPFFPAIRLITAVPQIDVLSIDYLYYSLKTLTVGNSGTSIPQLTIPNIKNLLIPIPPLSEQQSIVNYLDSAFAKIDAMKANAEKALNEAKALFQATLKEMLEPKEGWEKKKLKECCKELFAGGDVPKPNVSKNKTSHFSVPIYTNGVEDEGLYGYTNNARVNEPAVTISARGTIGATFRRYMPFYPAIRLITAVLQKDVLSIDYLYYSLKTLTVGNSGTSIPQLTIPNIKNMHISIPPLSEQQTIVATLDCLKSNVDRLQENYEKISQECDALKQAILRQVFE